MQVTLFLIYYLLEIYKTAKTCKINSFLFLLSVKFIKGHQPKPSINNNQPIYRYYLKISSCYIISIFYFYNSSKLSIFYIY